MSIRLVVPGIRFPIESLDPYLDLARRGVGGFCIFGGDSADQVATAIRALQDAAPHPLLIASDLEDGTGQQVGGLSQHPPAGALDAEGAEIAGIRTAVEARRLGITMTFAPVADVVSDPRNPIIQARAFADPLVSAPAFVRGARRMGLRTCAKHFPGHGNTVEDSHVALPLVEADAVTWRARDLPPFSACIEAGVDAVMTAHIACPGLTGDTTTPATLSRAVMTDLLRGELGFEGLLVTDALLMDGVLQGRTEAEAAAAALEAGCDVLLCPKDVEGVIAAAEAADVSVERLARAADPLPDPFEAPVARSVTAGGELPVARGPHPLKMCDLHGAECVLPGVAYERIGPDGELIESGGGTGLAVPTVAIVRNDRAWGAPLEVPPVIRALADDAELLIVLGPRVMMEGFDHARWVHAPGQDQYTLVEVARRAFR